MNVSLRHAVADLAQTPTDVGQTGAVTQQTGGRGMPGLVRDPAAEVQFVDPRVELVMNHWYNSAVLPAGLRTVPTPGWRARRRLGFRLCSFNETFKTFALTFNQNLLEAFEDADRGVVVADLGQIVPEHRPSAIAAEAVPPPFENPLRRRPVVTIVSQTSRRLQSSG